MATVQPEFSDLYSLAAAKGFMVIYKKKRKEKKKKSVQSHFQFDTKLKPSLSPYDSQCFTWLVLSLKKTKIFLDQWNFSKKTTCPCFCVCVSVRVCVSVCVCVCGLHTYFIGNG